MATETFTLDKTFNPKMVGPELDAMPGFPPFSVQFAGFENATYGRLNPFSQATKEITWNKGVADVADRAEIRVFTRDPLTPVERVQVLNVLTSHDSVPDTPSQAKEKLDAADTAALRAIFDSGIPGPPATRELLRLITRLLLVERKEDV